MVVGGEPVGHPLSYIQVQELFYLNISLDINAYYLGQIG
jgi:hypothetical protein